MRNKMIKKLIKGVFAGALACCCLLTATNVEAKSGYIYDSNNKPIQSSVGFVLNTEGVYNINSEAWKNGKESIAASDITLMTDLFVYQDKNPEDGISEERIYIVDGSSNYLFTFDKNLNFISKQNKFILDLDEFDNNELGKINTNVDSSNGSSTTKKLEVSETDAATFYQKVEAARKPNGDKEQFSIKCKGLSCVYRALKPVKVSENVTEYRDVIYLCDKDQAQILLLDAESYKVIQVISAPEKSDFEQKFAPLKMVTDTSGRMYVISENVFEGIILMNYDGSFMRYVGVNYTTLTFWQALTRNLKTEEQLAQETQIIQTRFDNLTIDDDNFLYTVARPTTNPITELVDDTTMVKKINQTGKDILIRNGYANPKGDLVTILTGDNKGGSVFSGITVNEFGLYTVADSNMGRLFTYDSEGNLLYISAGKGAEQTDIKNPVAVRYQGDNILVLDQGNFAVLRYELTDFAKSINTATKYQFYGDTENAAKEWSNVIAINPNYQLAYVGVGKTLHEEGRYQEAMSYFELGDNPAYYSRAYKKYRDEIIKKYFPYVLYGGVALVVVLLGYKIVKKAKRRNPDEEGEVI